MTPTPIPPVPAVPVVPAVPAAQVAAPFDVLHDRSACQFEAVVDGLPCVVDYALHGSVMHILHTGVPARLAGRGLAGALVHEVLAQARALGWRVRPVCSYVAAYMQRHPETHDLLERP